jgi:hypothetical protein
MVWKTANSRRIVLCFATNLFCDSVLEVEIVAKADIPSAMEMTYIAIAVSYPARPTHARSLHGNYMYM